MAAAAVWGPSGEIVAAGLDIGAGYVDFERGNALQRFKARRHLPEFLNRKSGDIYHHLRVQNRPTRAIAARQKPPAQRFASQWN